MEYLKAARNLCEFSKRYFVIQHLYFAIHSTQSLARRIFCNALQNISLRFETQNDYCHKQRSYRPDCLQERNVLCACQLRARDNMWKEVFFFKKSMYLMNTGYFKLNNCANYLYICLTTAVCLTETELFVDCNPITRFLNCCPYKPVHVYDNSREKITC